jgi:glutaredoxin 3
MTKLTIYTTSTCHWCKKTKEFLKENKISYTEKDATKSLNQKEMIEKSGQTGVPVLDIDGEIIVGYAPDEILKLVRRGKKKK